MTTGRLDIEALMAGKVVKQNPQLLLDSSIIKYESGQMDEALKLVQEAISVAQTAEGYLVWAMILGAMGRFEEATEKVYKALEIKPESIKAYSVLREYKKFKKGDPDIDKMIEMDRKSKKESLENRASIKFSIGKALYDSGDYDKAFSFWTVGNQLRHQLMNPPKNALKNMEAEAKALIDYFTPELARQFKDCGAPSERPVFVLGMPRSGTTLVEQILASHPDVAGVGEVDYFRMSTPIMPRQPGRTLMPHEQMALALKPDLLRETGEKYLRKLDEQNKTAKRVVDKQLFNHIFVGLICLSLPGARLIHCIRNPMDVGLSIFRNNFTSSWAWGNDLESIGHAYNFYSMLMDHWCRVFPERIYRVRYETLTENQEEESRKLVAFCGLEWDARCLNFQDTEKAVKTASIAQVRQPMYKKSVAAWKRFEEQLKPLYAVVRKHMDNYQ